MRVTCSGKMLPEFMFTVGGMQEIPREDFNVLNDKSEMCPTAHPSNLTLLPPINSDVGVPILQSSIKVEEPNVTIDLFPTHARTWQQHPMNSHEHAHLRLDLNSSSRRLLQSSDDPLICHGANDTHDEDHPLEFKTAIAIKNQNFQKPSNRILDTQKTQISGCKTIIKQHLKAKANQMSTQNRKLHQQRKQQDFHSKSTTSIVQNNSDHNLNAIEKQLPQIKKKHEMDLRIQHQAMPLQYFNQFEVKNGSKPQRQRCVASKSLTTVRNSHENIRSWLQKIAAIQRTAELQQKTDSNNNVKSPSPPVMKTNTGECLKPITFEKHDPMPEVHSSLLSEINSKSRTISSSNRRKEMQYADLPYMGEITLFNSKPRRGRKPKKADICHLIYKNYGTIVPGNTEDGSKKIIADHLEITSKVRLGNYESSPEQPLNLCLRDQSNDCFSISSSDNESLVALECASSICTTPTSNSETLVKKELLRTDNCTNSRCSTDMNRLQNSVNTYYQKLLEAGVLFHRHGEALGLSLETIQKDNQFSLKIPIPNNFFKASNKIETKPSPSIKSVSAKTPTKMSIKRKRSAIFIPPMPLDKSTNPTAEVSICKFKFTGGDKPSLQEKKMLSVDADGNYRYYNGTGDKILRGYEFISRDQLPNVPNDTCSTGVFLNADLDKIFIDANPPSSGLNPDLLQLPPESLSLSASSTMTSMHSTKDSNSLNESSISTIKSSDANNLDTSEKLHRKNKPYRRPTQREKLEQTFKDKGFLIQTQQLESAEGATYCKFRQLKKFTRYLFRNWKDYLPDSDWDKSFKLAQEQQVENNTDLLHNKDGLFIEHSS